VLGRRRLRPDHERHLRADPPSEEDVGSAEAFATQALAGAFAEVAVQKARTWVGVAGTVTTLSAIAQELLEYDAERTYLARLSLDQLRATTAALLASTHDERAGNPVIHPGRVDVIAGGAVIAQVFVEELHARAGIDELVVSEHDILDGIAPRPNGSPLQEAALEPSAVLAGAAWTAEALPVAETPPAATEHTGHCHRAHRPLPTQP
jgi:exopolyphosphatase/pppGpp-phosphohydrolase